MTLATLLVHAAVVEAAPIRRVAFVVVPPSEQTEREAQSLQSQTAAILANEPRLELIELSALYAPEAVQRSARGLAAFEQAVLEVEARASRLELKEARTLAEETLKGLPAQDLRSVEPLAVRLLVQTARIKRTLKLDDLGLAELGQAFSLDRALLAPRGLNSGEKTWFENARKTAAEAHTVNVKLESTSGSGWVWFDGKPVGLTPVTVSDVIPGRHFVTFAAPGAEPEHRSQVFGAMATLTFTSRPSPEGRTYRALVASLNAGFAGADLAGAAKDFLAWAKADEVLAVQRAAGNTTKVVRANATATRTTSVETSDAAAFAAALQRTLFEPLVAPVVEQPPLVVAAAPPPAASSRATPLVLAFAGLGAAVAGAGLLAGGVVIDKQLTAAQQLPDGTAGIPSVADSRQRRTQASGLTLGGAVLGGVGVVAAAIGGVWLLTLPSTSPTSARVTLSLSPAGLSAQGTF